jgi:putative ABC transport system permease protein
MTGPVELGWPGLAAAASLLLLNGALSAALGLGLGKKILVATIRTTVQLSILGWILVPVFATSNPYLTVGICVILLTLASRESLRRNKRRFSKGGISAFLSLLLGVCATMSIATQTVIDVTPWYTPRYLIPLVGMILGNGLNGISIGLDRALGLISENTDRVELLLMRGANRWEAAKPVAAEAIRAGMVPILNAMSVVGMVSIPGMMTGQILGGTPPELAAKYQILIMFLIAAATALSVTGIVFGAMFRLFDSSHRLRVDRIEER